MSQKLVTILCNKPPTHAQAERIVGGKVQLLYTRDGLQMLVDEDGVPKHLPVNVPASIMLGRNVVGNVLVLAGAAKWQGNEALHGA